MHEGPWKQFRGPLFFVAAFGPFVPFGKKVWIGRTFRPKNTNNGLFVAKAATASMAPETDKEPRNEGMEDRRRHLVLFDPGNRLQHVPASVL
jgi:hypothetical protein